MEAWEIATEIVNIFEDFLEEHGVDVPNPDKEQSENPAVIYGTDFGDLRDQITDYLSELRKGM